MSVCENTNALKSKIAKLRLKAALFDMDGVLFDSMPFHAKAWVDAFKSAGIDFDKYEAYLREGMTGYATIEEMYLKQKGRNATVQECENLYEEKCKIFESCGEAKVMEGVVKVLEYLKSVGLDIYIVTGSGQKSLFAKLERLFPGFFSSERMVTAYDVKKGKPAPEPYLMALAKGGLEKDEAFVVENAPLGVRSAHSAGIFTVAVNTGILRPEDLLCEGADILFENMAELRDFLPELTRNK